MRNLVQMVAQSVFILPRNTQGGNKIEIQVSFKITSTENDPLTEAKQTYKNAKEAAKQLGLNFDEEIDIN